MTTNGTRPMSPLQIQADRIRRRWWLVLAIAAIAVVGTALYSVAQQPASTGTKALRVSSPTRGPEQDAVLAQGYVEYFNQQSTKQILRTKTSLPADVTFSAHNSATSPIFYIEAVAPSPDLAATSATKLSDTFRDDINTAVRQSDERVIADLRSQIDEDQERLVRVPSPSTEFSMIVEEMSAWRRSITELKGNTTNQVVDVLPTAGVSSTAPNVAKNAALALIGGLVLGGVAAVALASVEDSPQAEPQRLVTSPELPERPSLNAGQNRDQSHA